MIEYAQKELWKLRKHIQDFNQQQKNMQLTAGSKLRETVKLGGPWSVRIIRLNRLFYN